MSIQIPLVLALLSQKTRQNTPKNTTAKPNDVQMVVKPQNSIQPQRNNSISSGSIRKLQGVAQLIGGTRGTQIGKIASVLGTVQSISSPMGALSLLMKNRINPVKNLNHINMQGQDASNIYNGINSMISNMDEDKKEELMNMAQNLFKQM